MGENEVIENSEGPHQMYDGVSLNEQRRFKPIIPYTEFMALPDLTAYAKLPEDYPITKIRYSYQAMETCNMAFVSKTFRNHAPSFNGDI